MKKLLPFVLLSSLGLAAQATPIAITTTTIISPKPGQAPMVNSFTTTSPAYIVVWDSSVFGSSTTNILRSPKIYIASGTVKTSESLYAATTYAEIQTKASALGITNLPADPSAGH